MENQQHGIHETTHLIFDKNNYKKQKEYILFVYLSPVIMGFLILMYGVVFEKSIHSFMYILLIVWFLAFILSKQLYIYILTNKASDKNSNINYGFTFYKLNSYLVKNKYISEEKNAYQYDNLNDLFEKELENGNITEEEYKQFKIYNKIYDAEPNIEKQILYLSECLGKPFEKILQGTAREISITVGFILLEIIILFVSKLFLLNILFGLIMFVLYITHSYGLYKLENIFNNYFTYYEFKLFMEQEMALENMDSESDEYKNLEESIEVPKKVDMTVLQGFIYLMEKYNLSVEEVIENMQDFLRNN